MIKTRFAPSPTGYLHIGGARTALFSLAYARKHGGKFVLRIEDTDQERSTKESIQAILDAMEWLKLKWDEGPFYQMQRLARYREVAQQLLKQGKAYYCYASKEELEAMRAVQRARGEKPRYDGRWRDSKATPPAGINPVVRFKNPLDGEAVFDDLVKGSISVQNSELDDLVLLRADGVPTYNFGVVVDDLDMGITHVIRGDDHVNNTPRQVNILKALGAPLPQYAHVPMITGADGERLSKRHGAVSVMQYRDEGYLPEALVNYLARLGWSHGDAEIFSMAQFIDWFDLKHISKSPARFDPEKLKWINSQYQKKADVKQLEVIAIPFYRQQGIDPSEDPRLPSVITVMKDRTANVAELAASSTFVFSSSFELPTQLKKEYYTAEAKPALMDLREQFSNLPETEWNRVRINEILKTVTARHKLKLPQIAMPLRVMMSGSTHTPSIDVTLELIGREEVLRRMQRQITSYQA
jgi:glutamyl-tRNA synthetase